MMINPIGCTLAANNTSLNYISDDGHEPFGFCGDVSFPNEYAFQLNFGRTYNKVGTLVAGPDETYAKYGITAGASVYLDKAIFNVSAPMSFTYNGLNMITSQVLWNGYIQNSLVNDTIVITHPPAVGHPVIMSLQSSDGSGPVQISCEHTDTAITVKAYSNLQGFVSFNPQGAWVQSLSNNVNTPVFDFLSGNLKITHQEVGGYAYDICVNSFSSSGVKAQVENCSSNSITVGFYDGGVKLLSVPVGTSFFYRRNAQVQRKLNGVRFNCQRGQTAVPILALKNLPSGNFWVTGNMLTYC